MIVVAVKDPVVVYVWLPLTVYGALPPAPAIVPDELELSPQLIVAVKSLSVPVELWSVNPAVGPLYVCSTNGGIKHFDDSGASPTLAVECAVAVLDRLAVSVITTLSWNVPSSAYIWGPRAVNVLSVVRC